jgi:hypothetical protein
MYPMAEKRLPFQQTQDCGGFFRTFFFCAVACNHISRKMESNCDPLDVSHEHGITEGVGHANHHVRALVY